MEKVSIRNLSVLGLVLMGASAVTAFVMPKKNSKVVTTGRLVNLSLDGNRPTTCKFTDGANPDCDFTATDDDLSFTSEGGVTSENGPTTGTRNTGEVDDNMDDVFSSNGFEG